jgi:hypothetical protein
MVPADAKQVAEVELTTEEKAAIVAVRDKRGAKRAAIKFTGKNCRAKVIRGRCCLFIDHSDYTDYFGFTWKEAFMALVFRIKLGAADAKSAELKKAIEEAAK